MMTRLRCETCGTVLNVSHQEGPLPPVHGGCGGILKPFSDGPPPDPANPKDAIGSRKSRLDLVPPALSLCTAEVMVNGAIKYGPYNWRSAKIRLSVYLAAAQRHLLALMDGEDVADDSGCHHAAHIAANMAIILDALESDCMIDDRPKKGPAAKLIKRFTKQS